MTKIRALFIFEMLGRPATHIKESLEKLIEQLGKQKGIEIVRKEIHEPKIVQDKVNQINEKKLDNEKELFTTFAEAEIIVDNFNLMISIILNMLPSHVEILSPNEINFKNFELSSLLTDLTIKIHKYDEVAKVLMLDRNNIFNKLKESEQRIRELEREIKDKKNK